MDNRRNMMMAIALSLLVLLGWTAVADRFAPPPAKKPAVAAQQAGGTAEPGVPSVPGAIAPAQLRDVNAVLTEGNRISIETPSLKGSINLKGAQIDDLVLSKYNETVKKDSAPVRLLSPSGTKHGYFAGFTWQNNGVAVPGPDTLWTADRAKLTPSEPVTLSWDNGAGQIYRVKISVDANYMFSIDQSMTNGGATPIMSQPFSHVDRQFGTRHDQSTLLAPSTDVDSMTIHIGPIGKFDDGVDYGVDYSDLDEASAEGERRAGKDSWIGFGDTYWLAAMVSPKGVPVSSGFRKQGAVYQAYELLPAATVPAGQTATVKSQFFAGAKEARLLDSYEEAGVPLFNKSIDWGWFEIIEKPIFKLLDFLFKLVGNFGVAIILMTFIVRGLMFPIAQRQFASMAGMRAIQPKLKALQERHKDDKPRLQQEMMKLYSQEKINPLGGCLPIVIQIPIFYALYKVLMLSIEMRHQPFIGWIRDLSAPDPANLTAAAHALGATWFPAFLGIGVLALMMGITMYLQFKLNPAAPDPVQQQMFSIMPWFMMFIMAPFAAGLLLYWVTSNILTIAQQKWLYSKHPALKNPIPAK